MDILVRTAGVLVRTAGVTGEDSLELLVRTVRGTGADCSVCDALSLSAALYQRTKAMYCRADEIFR